MSVKKVFYFMNQLNVLKRSKVRIFSALSKGENDKTFSREEFEVIGDRRTNRASKTPHNLRGIKIYGKKLDYSRSPFVDTTINGG